MGGRNDRHLKNDCCGTDRCIFTARSSYASAVLGIVSLSVCLSVRPSVCHACFVTK